MWYYQCPHSSKSQHNTRYNICYRIFIEVDILIPSHRDRLTIKINLTVSCQQFLLIIHKQRFNIIIFLRIIPEVHDLLIRVTHLIKISDSNGIGPVYLNDPLKGFSGLIISALIYKQKRQQQVALYKSGIIRQHLPELYECQILTSLFCIYQCLIIFARHVIDSLKPVRIGFYLLYIPLGNILAIEIIHTHHPVAESLNYLPCLIIYKSKQVSCIYIHLVIFECQLKCFLRTRHIPDSRFIKSYIIIVL